MCDGEDMSRHGAEEREWQTRKRRIDAELGAAWRFSCGCCPGLLSGKQGALPA